MSNLELGKIIQLNCETGSQEWHHERAISFCASDATVLMGAMPGKTRDDLLKEKFTGIAKSVSDYTENVIFAKGHRVEELARPIAEKRLDVDLTPEVFVRTVNGMRFLASLDGVEMPTRHTAWECKQFNKELFEIVSNGGELTEKHYWQLEHQILVAGINDHYFACSDGTDDCYSQIKYTSKPERREKLVAAWRQFEIDLANYVLPEEEAPKAIAEPVASLPAIKYEIDFSKGLSINSNLDAFKVAAQELVEKSKAILTTDQDFENAKARIKECEKAEANIKSLIDRVLGELGDVNTFKSDLESIGGWIRQSRLNQDKQVKSRTVERKAEIINAGKAAVLAHTNEINAKLVRASLPSIPVDFDAAVLRKSSFDSMQSAVNDAVADFKIKASRWETQILINLMAIDAIAKDHMFLFSDLQQLVHKDAEAMSAIAKQRIADHKVQEDARIQAAAKLIADQQIERDRQAEAQRVADLAKQNEVVAPAVQAPVAQAETVAAASTANVRQSFGGGSYGSSHIERPSVQQAPAQTVQPQVTAEQCPSHEVQLNDYQRGMIAGLELALRIHANCLRGGADFIDAINAVCTSDNIPAAPISKAA